MSSTRIRKRRLSRAPPSRDEEIIAAVAILNQVMKDYRTDADRISLTCVSMVARAGCANEADHLHNLPSLLSNYSPGLLRDYWEVERPAYCNRGDGHPEAFAPAWERLQHLLKKSGIA